MILTRLKKLMISLLAGTLFTGCEAPTRQPTPADLQYPVIVLFPGTGYERFNRAEELGEMGMQRVLMHKDVPILIDSAMRIYELAELKSTKSGLSIMLSAGVGRTPVTFKLVATRKSGVAAARELVRLQNDYMFTGVDGDDRREQLEKAETIPQFIETIETRR